MTLVAFKEIFSPCRVGQLNVKGFEVEVTGYIRDADGYFIALAFTESKTRYQAVWASFLKRVRIEIETPQRKRITGLASPGQELYETFSGELARSGGYATLIIHRKALSEYQLQPPPKLDRFDSLYVFGQHGSDRPFPIWLSQLCQMALLPKLPDWADILWPAALGTRVTDLRH